MEEPTLHHTRLLRACLLILLGLSACQGGAPAVPDSSTTTQGGCTVSSSSTWEGITIRFPEQKCTFTLAEAAQGISFAYEVVVEKAYPEFRPILQDAGKCDHPGTSTLFPYEVVEGNGQSYALADQGLCPGFSSQPVVDLQPGTYPDTFTWPGVNWSGPSDTNNPHGPPFPPGTYAFNVTILGSPASAEPGTPITGELMFTLTE